MKTITTLLLLLALVSGPLDAQVINVPADKTTIQAAIDSATSGDTVLVAEGTYLENINFNGKAITVASHFIEDGDTSHISKTIIDGSKFTNWQKASTVLMESGEDTTSVLMGFTITGGQGVVNTQGDPRWPEYSGSGVVIMNSGGKIVYNTIEENHLLSVDTREFIYGGGMSANVNGNRTAIIRHNTIRNNTVTAKDDAAYGGGLFLYGGRIIVEFNFITHNICEGKNALGGGLFWGSEGSSGTIEELIIRNNIIAANKSLSTGGEGLIYGGAITTGLKFKTGIIEIYNNLIYDNSTEGYGGGFYNWVNPALLYNNTFYNNAAGMGGNSIGINVGDMVMFNNIIGLDSNSAGADFYFNPENISKISLEAYNNLLRYSFKPENPVTASGNIYQPPLFKTDSYELADSSPAIGRGIDSVMIGNTWFFAPERDFADSARPNEVDSYIDLGAYESKFEPITLSIADLSHIGIYDYELIPAFHKDTLNYKLIGSDTLSSSAALQAIPEDIFADVDINHASDLHSINDTDRTATITVTSSDSSTNKIYSVLFQFLSSDATLDTLHVEGYEISPEFHPDTLLYFLELPHETCEVPEAIHETSSPNAKVYVGSTPDRSDSNEYKRTLIITVISEDNLHHNNYEILYSDCINSVRQLELNKIQIYPNPTNTNFTIDMTNIPPAQKIEILNIDGRIVRIIDHKQGNSITIQRGNLPSGIYFIRIHSDEIYVKKVIIQ